MLFNSYTYILLFLPAVLACYFILNSRRATIASKALLVAASLFFYSWWDIRNLPLIACSIAVNYMTGISLARRSDERARRMMLLFGLGFNLSLLGFFKYADFFISNINTVSGMGISLLKIALPLGISFFTLTQIAYLVDVYRGSAKEYNFLNYALFVTFFPHLLAGPILHHREMMPQFDRIRNKVLSHRNIASGISLFVMGLFKKVIIADTLAQWANSGFAAYQKLSMIEAWTASLSYTFQLYFDFSGYTDMALGSALLFNIRLPVNFNSPYRATDIQDFWRRWHITLSRFLRDYVYIPLGGNRLSEQRTLINLFLTFLIGGIWHGAGWTFVLWGFMHGIAMVIHRLWERLHITLPRFVAWFVTFNFVNIAWVFFRAKGLEDAVSIIGAMFGRNGIVLPEKLQGMTWFPHLMDVRYGKVLANIAESKNAGLFIIACMAAAVFFRNSNRLISGIRPDWRTALLLAVMSVYTMLNLNRVSQFIYFNF